MDKSIIQTICILAYIFVPIFGAIFFSLWTIKRRGERPPVEFILRRGPGESLRKKIISMDESFFFILPMLGVAPLILAGSIVVSATGFLKAFALPALILGALILISGLFAIAWWTYRHFKQRRNYLLGYLGERAVAEELERLLREGYHVFHDVPAEKGRNGFNLDHVVVGPTGLFAIETKTRRKGRSRPGVAAHKVFYDGRRLSWPWTEDKLGLQQVVNEAEWLSKWITKMTGLNIEARPILTFPGWYVETRAQGPVSVQNPKNVPSSILGNGVRVLEDREIDLIARQLDQRCRDVED